MESEKRSEKWKNAAMEILGKKLQIEKEEIVIEAGERIADILLYSKKKVEVMISCGEAELYIDEKNHKIKNVNHHMLIEFLEQVSFKVTNNHAVDGNVHFEVSR